MNVHNGHALVVCFAGQRTSGGRPPACPPASPPACPPSHYITSITLHSKLSQCNNSKPLHHKMAWHSAATDHKMWCASGGTRCGAPVAVQDVVPQWRYAFDVQARQSCSSPPLLHIPGSAPAIPGFWGLMYFNSQSVGIRAGGGYTRSRCLSWSEVADGP